MVGLVFEVALARRQHRELAGLGGAVQRCSLETVLSTQMQMIFVVAGAVDAHVEAVVVFLVDQRVVDAGVPSTCVFTRTVSSVSGSFSM